VIHVLINLLTTRKVAYGIIRAADAGMCWPRRNWRLSSSRLDRNKLWLLFCQFENI